MHRVNHKQNAICAIWMDVTCYLQAGHLFEHNWKCVITPRWLPTSSIPLRTFMKEKTNPMIYRSFYIVPTDFEPMI